MSLLDLPILGPLQMIANIHINVYTQQMMLPITCTLEHFQGCSEHWYHPEFPSNQLSNCHSTISPYFVESTGLDLPMEPRMLLNSLSFCFYLPSPECVPSSWVFSLLLNHLQPDCFLTFLLLHTPTIHSTPDGFLLLFKSCSHHCIWDNTFWGLFSLGGGLRHGFSV